MSGIDWKAVYDRYAPLLDRVATRAELSDLIWEMQGELGTSHAYEMGGDHRKPPAWPLGHLGAELKLAADGASYEIARIVAGDPWEPGADSPLNAIGVEAKVGERIVAVNGQPVSRMRAAAGAARAPGGRQGRAHARRRRRRPRSVVLVTTLPDEVPARYREWVERNRDWVHAQSRRPRRLLPPARHAVGGLRRVPSLLQHRVRPRRADRRRPLQPRRPRVAAPAREDRAQAHRLRAVALDEAVAVSGRIGRRAGGRAHQRARGLRRRHLLAQLQADGAGAAGRHAHVGRRRRHLAATPARRRQRRRRNRSSRSGSPMSASASRTTAPIRRSRSTTRRRTRRRATTGNSRRRWRRRWRWSPRSSRRCRSSASSRCWPGSRCRRGRSSALAPSPTAAARCTPSAGVGTIRA